MIFNLIGTGNTAWYLLNRLTAAGHSCAGVYGRNAGHTQELARATGTKVYRSLSEITDTADACIIAISDYAIEGIAAQLSFKDTVLLHTAGSVDINVLDTTSVHNCVIWPVYSIIKTDIPQHRQVPIVWEGNTGKAKQIAQELAKSLSDITFEAHAEQRKWLHLSAVLGNNFTNHLMSICEQLCKNQDIPFDILHPILQQTFTRIQMRSPYDMQTGPAKRGDTNTMGVHLQMLQAEEPWQAVYRALSMSIENMYNNDVKEKGTKS